MTEMKPSRKYRLTDIENRLMVTREERRDN